MVRLSRTHLTGIVKVMIQSCAWVWALRSVFTIAVSSIACLAGCALPLNQQPSSASIEHTLSGQRAEAHIKADFIAYDPNYQVLKARRGRRLDVLASSLAGIQAGGNDMACSTQLYLEAYWIYRYTADWSRLDGLLAQLSASMTNLDQDFAFRQSPKDGKWGICYDEWFLRTEATLASLERLCDQGLLPKYQVDVTGRIETPEKLRAYLQSLLISDIEVTGRDNRGELGDMNSVLSAAFFKHCFQRHLDQLLNSHKAGDRDDLHASFAAMYDDFLGRWQDPSTGYWGAWYRSKGRVYKTADLSMTYHTIAYRRGEVAYWPEIINTTLRIKNDPYPFGWLHNGHFNNHNNYDVARILSYGWPHMSDSQKREAAQSIGEMLAWTLEHSLRSDGSFEADPTAFSSVAADYYFGVSFLDEIGFWNPSKRFWTDEQFPRAADTCHLIRGRLSKLRLEDSQARDALEKLNRSCNS